MEDEMERKEIVVVMSYFKVLTPPERTEGNHSKSQPGQPVQAESHNRHLQNTC